MSNIMKYGTTLPGLWNRFWNDDIFSNLVTDNLPAANVTERDAEYKVDLSLPGFDKKNINIEIDKNVLKVSARQEASKEEKDAKDRVLRSEFSSSSFERNFVMPENIDTANISAKQENGVLSITLPKLKNAVEDKTRKIAVKLSLIHI